MATSNDARASTVRMGRLERRPWRRIILVVLGVAILAIVAIGVFRTLSSDAYSAERWRNFVIIGVSLGSIYALIALGYTLVYGILRMINFAHGEEIGRASCRERV